MVALATDVTGTQVTLRLAGLATKILSEVVRPCAVTVVAVTVAKILLAVRVATDLVR